MIINPNAYWTLIIFSLTSCVSYSSLQTAKTVEKGKLAGSVASGNNSEAEETFHQVYLRAGIAERTDFGTAINYTPLSNTLIMLDVKHMLKTKDSSFNMSIGGGISPIFGDDHGLALHLPYYFSLHSNNEKLASYFTPRFFYYFDLDKESDYNNSGFGLGSSFGIKFGNRFSIMPEWSFVYGRHNNSLKFNTLFSIGLGHRI